MADLTMGERDIAAQTTTSETADNAEPPLLLGLAGIEGLKDPPAGPVPVSRRGRAQKERITKVALDLFKEQPYPAITTTDISTRARLSTGTLYRYFVSKESIFISVLDRALMEMYDAARPVGSEEGTTSDIATNIHNYLMSFYHNRRIIGSARQLMAASPYVFQMWCTTRKHIHDRMYQRLRRHQQASSISALEPRGLMTALASMVDGYAQRAFIDEEFGALTEDDIREAAVILAGVWARAVFGV